MSKELVMYTRTSGCPFVTLAKRVLSDYAVPFREIHIDQNGQARQNVLKWTGFLSVPTLVVAEPGDMLPYETHTPLSPGASPRGIDRGAMITEPNIDQLTRWQLQHGFISDEDLNEKVG